MRFLLKVGSKERDGIFWIFLDFITIASSFIGLNISDIDVAKYFLAVRILKLIFIIKEIPNLNQEMIIFLSSLRKAVSILVPAIILTYIYAVVGLHFFSGIFLLI